MDETYYCSKGSIPSLGRGLWVLTHFHMSGHPALVEVVYFPAPLTRIWSCDLSWPIEYEYTCVPLLWTEAFEVIANFCQPPAHYFREKGIHWIGAVSIPAATIWIKSFKNFCSDFRVIDFLVKNFFFFNLKGKWKQSPNISHKQVYYLNVYKL